MKSFSTGKSLPSFIDHSNLSSTRSVPPTNESSINSAVAGIGASFSELQNEATPHDTRESGINLIIGQLNGMVPSQTLSDLQGLVLDPNWPAALPLESRCRIGLLRSPLIQEEKLTRFDYNLSMADEALRQGEDLRNQMNVGVSPAFTALWSACRGWRVGRLDVRSHPIEKDMFSQARRAPKPNLTTPIDSYDDRYSYLLTRLAQSYMQGNAQNGGLQAGADRGGNVRVRLQHHNRLQGQEVPLTELRTVINDRGGIQLHPWCSRGNTSCGVKDPLKRVRQNEHLNAGLIIHVKPVYLDLFVQIIDEKLNDYRDLLAQKLSGRPLLRGLSVLKLQSSDDLHILNHLADLHYLLAHAALDGRGSAAKSELFIRSLAAAAGLELPPFNKGFVPDLEAFVTDRDVFIASYAQSFEK